ncbi:MAG: molybdopterin-binding protein [Anaerolineales bacterium]|jgi:molybdopterin molybdotransferase
MPEFLRLVSPSEALATFMAHLPAPQYAKSEIVKSSEALNRVLAAPVSAPHPLPPFPRSTVDGYALRAANTYGASPSQPVYLKLIGEVLMGTTTELEIAPEQAAIIHTGGMLPKGADAVVMLEDTQKVGEAEIEVLKALGVGQHVLSKGEDVKAGETVIEEGTRLRSQEIGGLLALGVTEVPVTPTPKVGILATGDEIVSPEEEPLPGQIRDVNSYTLSALVKMAGGIPIRHGVIPDQYEALQEAAQRSHQEDDVVVIAAGSSVSERDITAKVLASLGEPGVLVHGVSMRPGKPTILAVADGVPVLGLPGNPISALVTAGLFLNPVVRHLSGLYQPELVPTLTAKMTTNVASETGREDYLPVSLQITPEGTLAEPVYGRSNLIFTLVRADGLVRIPTEATGLTAGQEVEVRLF